MVSAPGPDGALVVADDPIIGAPVRSTDTPAPAKMVDLDVYMQAVPTIFGLSITIGVAEGVQITGVIEPPTLNSFFLQAVLVEPSWDSGDYGGGSPGGDSNSSGFFQTVMCVKAESTASCRPEGQGRPNSGHAADSGTHAQRAPAASSICTISR